MLIHRPTPRKTEKLRRGLNLRRGFPWGLILLPMPGFAVGERKRLRIGSEIVIFPSGPHRENLPRNCMSGGEYVPSGRRPAP